MFVDVLYGFPHHAVSLSKVRDFEAQVVEKEQLPPLL